jgi:hypothetical protein
MNYEILQSNRYSQIFWTKALQFLRGKIKSNIKMIYKL